MTTTPNPTAEQVVRSALREALEYAETDALVTKQHVESLTSEITPALLAALRAAGLLVGNPTEEQIERATKAVEKIPHIVWNSPTRPDARTLALAALAAAAVAPQEPSAHVNPLATSGERVKNQADSSHGGEE